MGMDSFAASTPHNIAVIGNYLPRRCGIATFTTDLTEALALAHPEATFRVIAMDDTMEGYDYPPRVARTIPQNDHAAYGRTAAWLHDEGVDLVLVQHEYGIFGGSAGEYLLSLLRRLRMPIVTTCHTVLRQPNVEQRRVLTEIARLSARIVVMSRLGVELLQSVYGIPAEKIMLIHHGIPDVPFGDTAAAKAALDLAGRRVLLTFGLLSASKGIETIIRALPSVVATHPNAHYLVVGATHPHVKAHEGERYRESLQALAQDLGVAEHVSLVDRFVKMDDLIGFIRAADVYLTPYPGKEQITSGALAYTVGAGKAVISTPYSYATELLAAGRGILVPFGDEEGFARELLVLLGDDVARETLERRAYHFGRQMTWPAVARRYQSCFNAALYAEAKIPALAFSHSAPFATSDTPVAVSDAVEAALS